MTNGMTGRRADPYRDLDVIDSRGPRTNQAVIGTLAPNGRLHFVGAVLEPIPVAAFSLIMGQRSLSGSPTGSPVAIETMHEL